MKYTLATLLSVALYLLGAFVFSQRMSAPEECRPHAGGIVALVAPERTVECQAAVKEPCIKVRESPWLASAVDANAELTASVPFSDQKPSISTAVTNER